MKNSVMFAVASFVALTTLVSAQQQKPNFSGTWVVVSPESHAGQTETVRHGLSKITLVHEGSHGADHTNEYPLDGSEGRQVMKIHFQDIVSMSAASWNGDQLVIMRDTQYPDGRKVQSKMTFALNAEGLLVSEITDTVDGQVQPTVTVVMKKK